MVGKPTTKIGGAPPTQALPRATVKLQPTASPSSPSSPVSSVRVNTTALEEDDEIDEGPLNIMGWIALVGAIAAVIGVLSCWDKVEFFSEGVVNHTTKESREQALADWRKAPPPDGFKLPRDFSPFDKKTEDGGITSDYDHWEPDTPERPKIP